MISSKTHEIVVFYALYDPQIIYNDLRNGAKILDSMILNRQEELHPVKYIQRIGEDWRTSVNYGWLIIHGFMVFSDLVKKQALPTIVKSNYMDYMYDQDVYLCPNSNHDVLFSREEHKMCPNCGIVHDITPNPLALLWKDFHKFYGHKEFGALGIIGIVEECHGYDYPLRRLDTP